jgi:surface protein
MFYYCSSLEKLIIPDLDMTNTTNTSSFFYKCNKLNYIDLSRSNDATITKIATLVPTKKLATYGQILIPADSSQANIEALVAKYWKPIGPRIDMTSTELATELDEVKPGGTTKLYYGNSTPWYGSLVGVELIPLDEKIATIDKEAMTITSTGSVGTTGIVARNKDTQEIISNMITFGVSETDSYPNVIKLRLKEDTPNTNDIFVINGDYKRPADCTYNSVNNIYTYDAGAPITSLVFKNNYLKEIVKLNTGNMTSMLQMFESCSLTTLDLSDWDTSNTTNMSRMFNGCGSLTELDLSNFDMTKVTYSNSIAMLGGCTCLHTLRLDNCSNDTINKIITSSSFPTNAISGVTKKIFCKESEAAGLTPPTNWVFEYVAEEPEIPVCEYCGEPGCDGSCQDNEEEPDVPLYVSGQFSNKGDITEVRTMVNNTHTSLRNMFSGCFNLASIIGIEDWDTSNVTTMSYMFNYCHKLTSLDLSAWDTSNVTDMGMMFMNCSNLTTLDLSNFDMTNVTYHVSMFSGCYELHTVRLDNCDSATVNKIISELPKGTVNGETRKIYVSRFLDNITPPNGWVFALV